MGGGGRLLTNQAAQLLEGSKLFRQIPHVTSVGTGIYLGRWGKVFISEESAKSSGQQAAVVSPSDLHKFLGGREPLSKHPLLARDLLLPTTSVKSVAALLIACVPGQEGPGRKLLLVPLTFLQIISHCYQMKLCPRLRLEWCCSVPGGS